MPEQGSCTASCTKRIMCTPARDGAFVQKWENRRGFCHRHTLSEPGPAGTMKAQFDAGQPRLPGITDGHPTPNESKKRKELVVRYDSSRRAKREQDRHHDPGPDHPPLRRHHQRDIRIYHPVGSLLWLGGIRHRQHRHDHADLLAHRFSAGSAARPSPSSAPSSSALASSSPAWCPTPPPGCCTSLTAS